MQKSLSALCPSGEEIKDGGRLAGESEKNTIWALLLSLLKLITNFWQNYYNSQFLVTPNEMASLLLPWLASKRPAAILVWFVPSTWIFLAKAVCMVLGSSYLSAIYM